MRDFSRSSTDLLTALLRSIPADTDPALGSRPEYSFSSFGNKSAERRKTDLHPSFEKLGLPPTICRLREAFRRAFSTPMSNAGESKSTEMVIPGRLEWPLRRCGGTRQQSTCFMSPITQVRNCWALSTKSYCCWLHFFVELYACTVFILIPLLWNKNQLQRSA